MQKVFSRAKLKKRTYIVHIKDFSLTAPEGFDEDFVKV